MTPCVKLSTYMCIFLCTFICVYLSKYVVFDLRLGYAWFMDQLDKARKLLESKGFTVKKSTKTVAKTFQVSEDVLSQFLEKCASTKVKIRVAIDDALGDWVKKK
jgi:hypothetical protein